MPKRTNHRSEIIAAAARLFRSKGYSGTGLNEILEAAGAPKGSLYHYFPGGKEDIAIAAVRAGANEVSQLLEHLSGKGLSGARIVETAASILTRELVDSGYRHGCRIATVLLEIAPLLERIAVAGREAFHDWQRILQRALVRDGFSEHRARELALLVFAALEGGLILARVEQSPEPLASALRSIAPLLAPEREA